MVDNAMQPDGLLDGLLKTPFGLNHKNNKVMGCHYHEGVQDVSGTMDNWSGKGSYYIKSVTHSRSDISK